MLLPLFALSVCQEYALLKEVREDRELVVQHVGLMVLLFAVLKGEHCYSCPIEEAMVLLCLLTYCSVLMA